MIERLVGLVKNYRLEISLVSADCAVANLRRIYHASLIGAFISLIHISLFLFSPKGATPSLETWRVSIICTHCAIFILLAGAFFTARHLKKKGKAGAASTALQYAVVMIVMAAGVVIVTIDQIATSNITPYIVVCMIMGTVFLIDPVKSLLIFSAAYITYYFGIALTQPSLEQLLSNRVNGIASIGVGYVLSVIMWRLNVTNFKQKRRIIFQQQQLEQANRELERMAYFDALTGLPNRRHFDEILKREVALIERKGHESCLVMLDVDDFKGINDEYGHPIGDSFLVQLGQMLSQNIRKYDTLCRLGGDEFIILLPQTTLAEATAFAESLRERLAPCPFLIDSVTIRATASIGVARLAGSRDDALIRQYADVDKALYLAKQSGRNCVRCA